MILKRETTMTVDRKNRDALVAAITLSGAPSTALLNAARKSP
jgi:hypothetical protein